MSLAFRSNKGGATITMAFVVGLVGSIVAFSYFKGISDLKNMGRRLATLNSSRLITEQVVAKIMTDLQIAARYPDADGLFGAPAHAVVAPGLPTQPCGNEDPAFGKRFTLNAFLVPAGVPCLLQEKIPPTGYTAAQTNNFTKTIVYPRGTFSVPYFGLNKSYAPGTFLTPMTDPIVTIRRLGTSEFYTLTINFQACTPPALGGPGPAACGAGEPIIYQAVINTNSDYFQLTSSRY